MQIKFHIHINPKNILLLYTHNNLKFIKSYSYINTITLNEKILHFQKLTHKQSSPSSTSDPWLIHPILISTFRSLQSHPRNPWKSFTRFVVFSLSLSHTHTQTVAIAMTLLCFMGLFFFFGWFFGLWIDLILL